LMISLALQYCIRYDENTVDDPKDPKPAHISELTFFDISGIAYVFGNAVLTFNCHHSVPGLVTPVRPQAQLKYVFRSVLTFCCTGLGALCILAMLAFHNAKGSDCDTHDGPPCEINKLYNLNFSSYHIPVFAKLLDGYPVLMVALYPLLSITLRNNLLALFPNLATRMNPVTRGRLFTIAASLPMLLFAFAKPDIAKVTSITGAYFGCCIMYIIPGFLVKISRARLAEYGTVAENPSASEFQGPFWYWLVIGWGLVAIAFSTVDFACEAIPGCDL